MSACADRSCRIRGECTPAGTAAELKPRAFCGLSAVVAAASAAPRTLTVCVLPLPPRTLPGEGPRSHPHTGTLMAHDPTSIPAVQPLDAHNRRLLENVHPPAWTNPEPKDRYHLVVVGAGTAGLVTAAIGAALGARVALVERELMGGDCLNVGCVPSKAIIAAARG